MSECVHVLTQTVAERVLLENERPAQLLTESRQGPPGPPGPQGPPSPAGAFEWNSTNW